MKNKSGSYITEAAISLPILVIAICSLILIIKIIMICEGICFSTADGLIDIIRNPQENILSVSLCKKIEKKVLSDESELTNFKVVDADYVAFSEDEQKSIIVKTRGCFTVQNIIGIDGRISFEQTFVARSMAGKDNKGEILTEESFSGGGISTKVVVFPKYGEKYHTKECTYVKRAQKESAVKLEMEKNDAGIKGYKPCLVCGGVANG